MIQIVGPRLSQWDTGRSIRVNDSNATHVHIANRGDSHAPILEIVNGEAKIPDYLLQTGKELCVYLVQDGITQESDIFSVRKRERPENYVYEDDRRNYIYELITNAQTATAAANQAAVNANNAAVQATEAATNAMQTANQAATNAVAATQNAIAAAGKVDQAVNTANVAAENANEAAAKAEHTAKALMVVGSARGTNISLDNAINQFLVGLRICGKTTQNGTPTPTTPVDLVSVGHNDHITVNVAGKSAAQSMTIATPNGLCGIPVTSGGNYTDANGQKWICDEIDMGRGVRIQRVYVGVFDGSSDESITLNTGSSGMASRYSLATPSIMSGYILCNCAESSTWGSTEGKAGSGMEGSVVQVVYIGWSSKNTVTVAEFRKILAQKPLIIIAPLDTPIETPLTEEELATFETLRTYRGNTTVTNDAGAHMELEYVMDAKKYIDSLIIAGGGSILPATVE